MPTLTDTHVHLYHEAFASDLDAVVGRARGAGVARMLLPAVDAASIADALALADRFDGVYAMAGLHPTYVQDAAPDALGRVTEALADPRVVAVGETGLDYYWSREHVDLQQRSLREHARLAAVHGLPLVLHNRDQKGSDECSEDLIRLLREVRQTVPGGDSLRGVFHCFSGPGWLAQEALDLGFHLGLGGTLTFQNGGAAEAIVDVPLDRLVLETDGPYLAPKPHRGQRNEPAHVALVAQKLAELRGLSVDEVAERTSATAAALFGLS